MQRSIFRSLLVASFVVAPVGAALWFAAPPVALPAAPLAGPDLIIGDIPSIVRRGADSGYQVYAVGHATCNIGSSDANWIATTSDHPVFGASMYRLLDGRFEMVGVSWLKHGVFPLESDLCGNCVPTGGSTLAAGCSDVMSANFPGNPEFLGPRSEVNAFNGVFPFPEGGPANPGPLDRWLRVLDTELDPQDSADYWIELRVVHPGDAQDGNGGNNASHRKVLPSGAAPNINLTFAGNVVQSSPAIDEWAIADPSVTLLKGSIPNEGNFTVGAKVTDLGGGEWQYEYAVYNDNSDRAIRAFGVKTQGAATISQIDQRLPFHHSGEPYPGNPWATGVKQGFQYWATKSFGQNPDADALRWGTLANFRFVANTPPTTRQAGIVVFKPGGPMRVFFQVPGPQ